MADKTNFTPDEWKIILESVMMAGMAVSAAEPSGVFGLLKEGFAEGNALAQAKMDPGSNALVKAVVADFGTSEGRGTARDDLKQKISGSKPPEIKAKCIETLRQAAAVLDAKAPSDFGGIQELAPPDQPTCRRGGLRGRASRFRWC